MPSRRTPTVTDPADLRQRILDTARALLESDGVAALSMREVARRAGVTHQAPYHHFGDRAAILAELVTRGFEELAQRLARANDRANDHEKADGKREALVASAQAYVGFAIDHPGVFRIMFRPEMCDAARYPAVQAAGDRARGELLRLVELMHGKGRGGGPDEVLASTYWAQVHGLACLIVDGPIGQRLPGRRERLAHLRAVSQQFADILLGNGKGR